MIAVDRALTTIDPLPILGRVLPLLAAHRDVLEARHETPETPPWARARGWDAYLAALDADALARAERDGPGRFFATDRDAPASLAEVARAFDELTAAFDTPAPPEGAVPTLTGASPRKRAQVRALTEWVRALGPTRVVDVGAGHGHLTRHLAASLGVQAEGVERDDRAVARARTLASRAGTGVTFRQDDAAASTFEATDLVIGLHACGELSDRVVDHAREAGASVLLVGCCYQKISTPTRRPRSALGRELGFEWSRAVLGLANLATVRDGGLEAAGVMRRRETRYALRWLLVQHGVPTEPGDETRGIHRRQFKRPLTALAPRAFAVRGLPAPSAEAVADAERRAADEHARVRRFALARTLFARPLELAIAADRAAALAGGRLLAAFDGAASPRNVAVCRARPCAH